MTDNKNIYCIFETWITELSDRVKKYNRVDVNYALKKTKVPYNSEANSLLAVVRNIVNIQFALLLK